MSDLKAIRARADGTEYDWDWCPKQDRRHLLALLDECREVLDAYQFDIRHCHPDGHATDCDVGQVLAKLGGPDGQTDKAWDPCCSVCVRPASECVCSPDYDGEVTDGQ